MAYPNHGVRLDIVANMEEDCDLSGAGPVCTGIPGETPAWTPGYRTRTPSAKCAAKTPAVTAAGSCRKRNSGPVLRIERADAFSVAVDGGLGQCVHGCAPPWLRKQGGSRAWNAAVAVGTAWSRWTSLAPRTLTEPPVSGAAGPG